MNRISRSGATDARSFVKLGVPLVISSADKRGDHGADEAVRLASLDEYAAAIKASAAMDRIRWPRMSSPGTSAVAWTGASFDENIRFLKDFMKKRVEYLNKAWGEASGT